MASRWGRAYAQSIQARLGRELPNRDWADNPVTGAVGGSTGQFGFFVARFGERVDRLWAALPNDRDKMLEKLANVGTDNWYGYFAELAAWDFFGSLPLRLAIEVHPPGPQLGPSEYVLDGRLEALWDLHFDVKALADSTKMVLEGIAGEVEARHPEVALRFSHPLDLGQSVVADVRRDLILQIEAAIVSGTGFVDHAASSVRVRIHGARPAFTVTEHGYNPYQQAEAFQFAPLSDARQFIKGDRNVIVFVVHPWFNLTNTSGLENQQQAFFRSMARRVFCGLTKDSRPLTEVARRAPAGLALQDAARHLSGLVFLVDHSVVAREGRADASQVRGVIEAFVYVNPNAAPSSDGKLQFDQLRANAPGILPVFDDFRFDNY